MTALPTDPDNPVRWRLLAIAQRSERLTASTFKGNRFPNTRPVG